jgi:hypothetical protein
MPTHAAVTPFQGTPLVHTNHCLDAETLRRQAERAPALLASSQARYTRAVELAAAPLDVEALIALTRDPVICRRSEPPYHVESSGAVVMRPATRELWAVRSGSTANGSPSTSPRCSRRGTSRGPGTGSSGTARAPGSRCWPTPRVIATRATPRRSG